MAAPVSAGSAPVPVATADPKLSANYGIPARQSKLSGVVATRLTSYSDHQRLGPWLQRRFDRAPKRRPSRVHLQRPRWSRRGQRIDARPDRRERRGTSTASNAGKLTGVNTIQTWHSFQNTDNGYRTVEATLGAAIRAADMKILLGHDCGDGGFRHRRHPQRAGPLPGDQPGRRLGYPE